MMPEQSILLVEDEAAIATVMRDRLRSFGYEVNCVMDGLSAIRFVNQRLPNCILLDLELPGMNGFEVLEQIRNRYPMLPVVIVTASSTRVSATKALELGAVGFVLKPFDPETLRTVVEQALHRCDMVN